MDIVNESNNYHSSHHGSLIGSLVSINVTNNRTDLSIMNHLRCDAESGDLKLKSLISFYVMGVTTICICFIGSLGNVLLLIVFKSQAIRSHTTRIYLMAMATVDLLVLLATFLTALKDTREPNTSELVWTLWSDFPIIPRLYPYFHATAVLLQVNSVWLTVAFTFDRYLMICHPFLAKRWCSVNLARLVTVVIGLASIVYGLPRYFEYSSFEVDIPLHVVMFRALQTASTGLNLSDGDLDWLNNISTVTGSVGLARPALANASREVSARLSPSIHIVWYQLSRFGQSYHFRMTYNLWSWLILVVCLPSVSIAVMNGFLIREIRRTSYRSNQKYHPALDIRRYDTEIMLIGVTTIFFICQLPAAVSHIVWGVASLEATQRIALFLLNEIGNLLIVINSAINLLPFYIFSRRFRRQFTILFCPCRLVHDHGWHCVYIPRWMAKTFNNEGSDTNQTFKPFSSNRSYQHFFSQSTNHRNSSHTSWRFSANSNILPYGRSQTRRSCAGSKRSLYLQRFSLIPSSTTGAYSAPTPLAADRLALQLTQITPVIAVVPVEMVQHTPLKDGTTATARHEKPDSRCQADTNRSRGLPMVPPSSTIDHGPRDAEDEAIPFQDSERSWTNRGYVTSPQDALGKPVFTVQVHAPTA